MSCKRRDGYYKLYFNEGYEAYGNGKKSIGPPSYFDWENSPFKFHHFSFHSSKFAFGHFSPLTFKTRQFSPLLNSYLLLTSFWTDIKFKFKFNYLVLNFFNINKKLDILN